MTLPHDLPSGPRGRDPIRARSRCGYPRTATAATARCRTETPASTGRSHHDCPRPRDTHHRGRCGFVRARTSSADWARRGSATSGPACPGCSRLRARPSKAPRCAARRALLVAGRRRPAVRGRGRRRRGQSDGGARGQKSSDRAVWTSREWSDGQGHRVHSRLGRCHVVHGDLATKGHRIERPIGSAIPASDEARPSSTRRRRHSTLVVVFCASLGGAGAPRLWRTVMASERASASAAPRESSRVGSAMPSAATTWTGESPMKASV